MQDLVSLRWDGRYLDVILIRESKEFEKRTKATRSVRGRFTVSLAITFCTHFRIFVGAVQNKYPK